MLFHWTEVKLGEASGFPPGGGGERFRFEDFVS